MNKISRIGFNAYHSFNIRKHPKVHIDFQSIDKYIPGQDSNIVAAARKIAASKTRGKVIVSSPFANKVEVEVKIPGKTPVKKTITDQRRRLAEVKKTMVEDEYLTNLGYIPKGIKNKLNYQYQKQLDLIAELPFNFKPGIIDAFKKALIKANK